MGSLNSGTSSNEKIVFKTCKLVVAKVQFPAIEKLALEIQRAL
jgi:hypothetical protein